MKVTAIIVGAGASTRMGIPISKQLIKICNQEVIVHTLKAFQASKYTQQIVVVCREEDRIIIEKLIKQHWFTKVTDVVAGADTRQGSVQKGLNQIEKDTDYIAVHDGARPLVLPRDIDQTITNAIQHGSSALGVAVKDTIKEVDAQGLVTHTPERSRLIAVQTPQVFKKELYLNAVNLAIEQGKDYTDDCQLVEATGERVYITKGSYTNIKVTTPDDVSVAEALLHTTAE